MAQYNRLFGNIPTATRNLFLVNALMFIATCINQNYMVATFAMFFPTSPFFHWWQPVTHMFMHGGFWHIFLNMWCLLMFGSALERSIGSRKFVLFYFVAGLGAVAVHTLVQYLQGPILNVPTLGASGAIYGIQIGYAMLYPNDIWTLVFPPVSLKAKWFVLIFIAIELFTGITGTADGVAHFAHLGGALFGFLLMLYWKKTGKIYRNWN
ncbi:MAG: rhomboid family intramembrane serine protease [Bacteroidales bacterium]|jgi:membrane associated rhomboid family serine protease|nr:rhomboid family intramembrane serine protease [Bacteroidales bacterium]MEE3477001.1 rhomboid family intramembrane serine protease [Candidatus Cryptobacteroides sp.]MBQ2530673.1 rhomboid family intramembrane serine protease [Bacteroidales bacterium]MBQ5410404.1 rhomboid family intramembrane serine protease [Bacteroidales bacterium]MBQ5486766.1 rhomboid family intramembrane serine protease [Bacteroidales bacterium]